MNDDLLSCILGFDRFIQQTIGKIELPTTYHVQIQIQYQHPYWRQTIREIGPFVVYGLRLQIN